MKGDIFANREVSAPPCDHCGPCGSNNPLIQPDNKYFQLAQHPAVKKIYSQFDHSKTWENASLADINHFDNMYPGIEICLFLGESPCNYTHYYSLLFSNIYSYALYKMVEVGDILLYSFDSSAVLSDLKIDDDITVNIPFSGRFVIEFLNSTGETVNIVLTIERNPESVEWIIYVKNAVDFATFNSMLNEAYKKYNYYRGKVFDNKGTLLQLPDVSFDDIYLDSDLKEDIRINIIDYVDENALNVKRLNGIPTKRGVIFVGLPGTGKTYLTRVLARTLKTTFMIIIGLRSICELQEIFEFAAQFDRIIILFEDIDIYMKDRDLGSPLLPMLLNKLDGAEVNNHLIVLCTTNNVEALDNALKNRPGRFDRTLTFNSPSTELKAEMLKGLCKGKKCSNIDFEAIVRVTPVNYTGAHLKEVYITACNDAISQGAVDSDGLVILTTDLFLDAVNSIKNRQEPSRIGFGGEDG